MEASLYPVTLGTPSWKILGGDESINQPRVIKWPRLLKWSIFPIALALLPVVLLATSIVFLYRRVVYGERFQEFLAKNLVLPSLSLDKNYLDMKRAEIVIRDPEEVEETEEAFATHIQEKWDEIKEIDEVDTEIVRDLHAMIDKEKVFLNSALSNFVKVKTEDGVELSGIRVEPVGLRHVPKEKKKWVVYFNFRYRQN